MLKIKFNFINLKNKMNIILLCFVFIIFISFNRASGVIEDYRGLHTIFTKDFDKEPAVDTIGIGQALLYSGWLENVYTYGEKNSLARRVIEVFWYKRQHDGRVIDTEDFKLADNGNYVECVNRITPEVLGLLISYIRKYPINENHEDLEFCNKSRESIIDLWVVENKINRDKLKKEIKNLEKKVEKKIAGKLEEQKKTLEGRIETLKKLSKEEYEILSRLEQLKRSPEFLQETAEAILWVFFEKKFKTENEFKRCLDQIDSSLYDKLSKNTKYTREDFERFSKEPIDPLKSIKDSKFLDIFNYYVVTTLKKMEFPPKIESKKALIEIGGKKCEFYTCFESVLLDIISTLLYKREEKKFDINILPKKVFGNKRFLELIEKVFDYKDGKFLNEEKTRGNLNRWLELIEGLDYLIYTQPMDKCELKSCFENFEKIFVDFFNINLIDLKDKKKDKLYWEEFFKRVSESFSTPSRNVKFSICFDDIIFPYQEGINFNYGAIKIEIGQTVMFALIKNGHAEIRFPERIKTAFDYPDLKNKLSGYTEKLESKIIDNINLVPFYLSMPSDFKFKDKKGRFDVIDNLYYYSWFIKDPENCINFFSLIDLSREENKQFLGKIISALSENEIVLERVLLSVFNQLKDDLSEDSKVISNDVLKIFFDNKNIKKSKILKKLLAGYILDPLISCPKEFIKYFVDNFIDLLEPVFRLVKDNGEFAGDILLNKLIMLDDFEIAEKIINKSTDKDFSVYGINRNNALHVVCISNYTEDDSVKLAQMIIKKNRQLLNEKNGQGNTALHLAVREGNFQLVRFLIKEGASKEIRNNDGYTAKDLAKEKEEILKLFDLKS